MTNHNELIDLLLRRRLDSQTDEQIMASAAIAVRHMQQQINSLDDERIALRWQLRGLEHQYTDLITQVACKFPGETRHDTAKRYIVEREAREVAGPQQSVTDSIDSPQEPLK